jgi:hypothetical protein
MILLRRFNETMSLFNMVEYSIKYKLIKTFCMPLYGSQLWDISSKKLSHFYVTWRKCIRKSLNLPYTTHCNLLHLICNDFAVETQIHMRTSKFIYSCLNSDNSCVKLCVKLAFGASDSALSSSIDFLCTEYNITKYFIKNSNNKALGNIIKAHDCQKDEIDNMRRATQIKELLFLRDNNIYQGGLSMNEVNELIEYLCCYDRLWGN